MYSIGGQRLRIGAWEPAWRLDRALLMSSHRSTTSVQRVIVAPWRRSERTDWVWRLPDVDYPDDRTFGGTSDTSMGGGWGSEFFRTEVEAWAYAVGWYRTRIREAQRRAADEIERCAVELGEAIACMSVARRAAQAAEGRGE